MRYSNVWDRITELKDIRLLIDQETPVKIAIRRLIEEMNSVLK